MRFSPFFLFDRKQGANGTNVNELTHQQLTDIGRAPCFYDCAVQVEKFKELSA